MDSKKLTALPSSNQQGTSRVSDATMIATSRNAPSMLEILSSTASRTRKDYTSSARPGKVLSQLQRLPDQAPIASRRSKANMSTTRGISTSSVDSMPSLSTTLGLKSTRLLQNPFAVSGLRVQALVSGLLYSKIQRQRLLTDLGLL
jgi:hypothetical protein